MSLDGYLLSIDQGTTSSRALILDIQGNIISQKNQLIEKDAATLILSHNEIVRDNFDAYNSETNEDAKQLLSSFTFDRSLLIRFCKNS